MKSKWILKHNKDHCTIVNEGGKNIGYQPNAGVQIMEEDGFGFKDLNGRGRLDAFEDWRLPMKERRTVMLNKSSVSRHPVINIICVRTVCL